MSAVIEGQYQLHLAALAPVVAALMTRPRTGWLLVMLAGAFALAHAVLAGAGLAWIVWAALFTLVTGVHYAALEMRARSG